jgi:acetyl-CoA carboxylase biotin carboxyl carrier protein
MFDETIAERIRPLAEAFHDGGYARLCVRDGAFEVEFRRAPSPAAPHTTGLGAPDAAPARPHDVILADVVGIVRFTHPAPTEGAAVDADRDLAFVEALGIRNPVRSGGPGRIAAIFVADGQPVEYGQPLFTIER